MNNLSSLEAIFFATLDKKSPQERAAYLDEACADDPDCRRRVERMLAAQAQAGSFLEQPALTVAATSDEPSATERPGTVIGPYKLLQQIGDGGMGVVWMAEQTDPVQRKVAVKVIKPGLESSQVIARFEAERQALAMMDHVNIARVLDAGATESGLPYFVMELVHGVPITKYCDDNHLTPRERLELFVPVCQAIQHAHQKGIIHRDIKPSNVMITLYDGKPVPKIIDFGVAKATEQKLTERTLFTQYGTMVGTLEYMSPEQAEMSALGVDTRSDIYSLGVLLYELLTGSTPLSHKRIKEAAYAEILRMIKEEEPQKPSTRLSESGEALASISAQRHMEPAKLSTLMQGELDWIVMKTLEKDRNRRYETASGFAADVQRYLKDEPVLACPPSAGYRFRKFARRNKGILATAAVIIFALVVGTGVSTWQAIRATQAEGLAEDRLESTNANYLAAEQSEYKAKRGLVEARLAQARAGSLSRRVGQRFGGLEALAEATKIARDLKLPESQFLELRNAAIACLALPDLRLDKQWPGWPEGSDQIDFDGELKLYARVDKHGAVSIRRVADDVQIARLPNGTPSWPRFSRDGKFLILQTHVSLTVWKLGGPEPVPVVQLGKGDYHGFAFSADSRHCAIGQVNGPIRLYDLFSGQPPRELPKGRAGADLAFHPQGHQIAVSCGSSVEIRDLATGKVDKELQHDSLTTLRLAWNSEGKTLAVVCNDLRIHLWDVAAGKKTVVLEGIKNGGTEIAFNHGGDLLASTGWEGKLRFWDPRTGEHLFSTWSGMPGTSPRFGTDDRLLAADIKDGQLGLWEVVATGAYRTLVRAQAGGRGNYQNPTIHTDKRLLAVGMIGGVGMWDLDSGQELGFLELPGINLVLFDESGALLTNGSAGLLRWPIQANAPTSGLRRVGPPQKLSLPGSLCKIARSRDGRVLASAQFDGALVLHADRPHQPVLLGRHDNVRYIAVSPDGFTVATGGHGNEGVKVWEAKSGKLIKELPMGVRSYVGFSPNGKWLATSGGGLRLWAVDSWKEALHIGGSAFAFFPDPDGSLLAVETNSGVVRLVDPETGREFARLEDPNQDRATFLSFSPDGTQLVATGEGHSIHVWDLRLIRKELGKMGLDWDLPAYPPARPVNAKPLQVEVDLGELAPKFTDYLWKDLLAGNEGLHRFLETKHEGTLTLAKTLQVHLVEMKADTIYVLDLESKAFDTFLTVEDRDGARLAFNDDISSNNLNSRIIFTAPMAGTYRIIATPYATGATGPYALRIRELVKE